MGSNYLATSKSLWGSQSHHTSIKVCVIGAGKMARLHLLCLKDIKGVVLAGITSRNGASASLLKKEFGIEASFQDWELMLQQTKPDALIVAVSHEVSFELYKGVLSHRIPCLLEKPAGYSSRECLELVELSKSYGTLNMVAMNRRFYSTLNQALIEIMHHGPVRGILIEAHEPLQLYRNRLQFDAWVYDNWRIANSIHGIDLFRMIGGEVSQKINTIIKSDSGLAGESINAVFEFVNGATGVYSTFNNSPGGFRVKIFTDGICVEMHPLHNGFISYLDGKVTKLTLSMSDQKYKEGLYDQMVFFLSAIVNKLPINFPASDLTDHYLSLRLAERLSAIKVI